MNHLLDISGQKMSEFSSFLDFIKTAFGSFDYLKDTIDILVLTVIFMCVFSFIKGRKAGAILIAIAICVMLLVLSNIFELDALSYVFSGIFDIGAVFLIIIFQPEIRGALEKVGSGSISGILNLSEQKKKRQLYYNTIENICKAVKELSESKTGALIVLVRTTKLDDIIQTGVTINADVSSLLLGNIFFNNAPLHDGAVIVDEGRIAAAGCLLPLTRRSDVDANLGTRHRAAIGISETSDSVTIVVSEETGTISVAFDCTLTRDYTPDTLKRFLMRKLLKSHKNENYN